MLWPLTTRATLIQSHWARIVPIGCLLGSLSLLNLVTELSPIRIIGKLEKWVEAYWHFIATLGDIFFGWIDFGWMSVSTLELHALALVSLLFMAIGRTAARVWAYSDKHLDKKSVDDPVVAMGFSGGCLGVSAALNFSVALFLVVVLPSILGIVALGIFTPLTMIGWLTIFSSAFKLGVISTRMFIKDLFGTASVFLVLIAFNYSMFNG